MSDYEDLPDEAKVYIRAFMGDFVKMLKGEATHCLNCHQPVEKLKQVGRCVYAAPCGCRQYQGRAPKKAGE